MRKVYVIFGEESVRKVNNGIDLNIEEKSESLKEFHFETEAELIAFKKGIEETIGWREVLIV